MQRDISSIESAELVQMLMKGTEYYMDLCKEDGDVRKRNIVQEGIDLIIAELKSREGYVEIIKDTDLGIITPE